MGCGASSSTNVPELGTKYKPEHPHPSTPTAEYVEGERDRGEPSDATLLALYDELDSYARSKRSGAARSRGRSSDGAQKEGGPREDASSVGRLTSEPGAIVATIRSSYRNLCARMNDDGVDHSAEETVSAERLGNARRRVGSWLLDLPQLAPGVPAPSAPAPFSGRSGGDLLSPSTVAPPAAGSGRWQLLSTASDDDALSLTEDNLVELQHALAVRRIMELRRSPRPPAAADGPSFKYAM